MKASKGFSLLEISLALSLGILLASMVVTLYLSILKTFSYHIAITSINSHIKIAATLIQKDIHKAGTTVCDKQDSILKERLGVHFSIPKVIEKAVIPGSSFFTVTGVESDPIVVEKSGHDIIVAKKTDITKNELLLASNCEKSVFIRTSHIKLTKTHKILTIIKNATLPIPPYKLWKVFSYAYYISQNKQLKEDILNRKSLTQDTHVQNALVNGVTHFNVNYLVKTGNGYQLYTQQQVTKAMHIQAVQINLLFQSLNKIYNKNEPYVYMAKEYKPGDKNMHKQLSFFVSLYDPK